MDKKQKGNNKPHQQKDNKCFQYAAAVALNQEEFKKDPQGITKIKRFVDTSNKEGINFTSAKIDWKKKSNNCSQCFVF